MNCQAKGIAGTIIIAGMIIIFFIDSSLIKYYQVVSSNKIFKIFVILSIYCDLSFYFLRSWLANDA